MKVRVNETCIYICENISFPDLIRETFDSAYLNGKAEDPFFVCDLGDVVRKHTLWLDKLPTVEPFYAVKCNPSPMVVSLLAGLNIGFDCASKGEISQILALGVSPNKIIYANPCKQSTHIRYAEKCGVRTMTFDSISELKKIYSCHPSAKLVLRIFVGAAKARCPLGLKFGASMEDVVPILDFAHQLGMDVIGVSFHVGSGCFDPSAYSTAILMAHSVFEISASMGYPMCLLDIGGGFPGNIDCPDNYKLFIDVCDAINSSLDQWFPASSGVRVIAEPGRYYVSSAFQLACSVTSVKTCSNTVSEGVKDDAFSYYLNDGVYGSFNCVIFDHYVGDHYPLDGPYDDIELHRSTFWGPTCDSMDKIVENVYVRQLSIGDKIVFKGMGAYTMAAGSTFNGFEPPYVKYVVSKSSWDALSALFVDKFEVIEDEPSEVFPLGVDSDGGCEFKQDYLPEADAESVSPICDQQLPIRHECCCPCSLSVAGGFE